MRALVLGAMILGSMTGTAAAQDGSPPGPSGEHREGGMGPRGRLFISPMGEPFRGSQGSPSPQDLWFDGADTNHDGVLTVEEMAADGARFFAALDVRHDGEIDPDDIERYETELAPEIRTGGGGGMGSGGGMRMGGRRGGGGRGHGGGGGMGHRGGGGAGGDETGAGRGSPARTRNVVGKQGAARFGYLDYPEPVTVADRNFNRGIDPAEFAEAAAARFAMLDSNGDAKLEKGELPRLSQGFGGPGGRGKRRDGREAMPDQP